MTVCKSFLVRVWIETGPGESHSSLRRWLCFFVLAFRAALAVPLAQVPGVPVHSEALERFRLHAFSALHGNITAVVRTALASSDASHLASRY